MISKYTLYLGLNDKDSKIQKISTIEAYKIVENMILKLFDGGTIYEAVGVYKHADGTVVFEKTLRIEILFAERIKIMSFLQELKLVFNQESIALQEEQIDSTLI